ncbi:hypothetical protein VTL71DRAFT_5256 [Oculimacula yallundae]|uniref:Uncharacterized protein n=1 Tax=Oculimacula yallundae TaxID=86028 RepID=A0ABR4C239_9HELO
MIEESRRYCIKPPESSRTLLVSQSSIKTLIVTLQGVQAISTLTGNLNGQLNMAKTLSVSSIFFPLSILGLLRLCAAPWLTDEFVYAEYDERESQCLTTPSTRNSIRPEIKRKPLPTSFSEASHEENWYLNPETGHPKETTSIQMRSISSSEVLLSSSVVSGSSFHPTTSWRGRTFRVLFMAPILLLVALCFYYLIPWTPKKDTPWAYHLSATLFLLTLLYLVLITVTLFIFAYYLLRDVQPTTVIPCLVSPWYQIYTLMLTITTVLLVVIAAVETRKAPCGIYTSWPVEYNVCPGTLVQSNATSLPFGIAVRYAVSENDTDSTLPSDRVRITDFDGWCVGTEGTSHSVTVENITRLGL